MGFISAKLDEEASEKRRQRSEVRGQESEVRWISEPPYVGSYAIVWTLDSPLTIG
jgi:hypothetical protein